MSGKKIELETSLPGDARPSDAALSARAYDNTAILPPFKSEGALAGITSTIFCKKILRSAS